GFSRGVRLVEQPDRQAGRTLSGAAPRARRARPPRADSIRSQSRQLNTRIDDPMLSPDVRFRPGKDVLRRELRGRLILLNALSGRYFELDRSGAAIWR